MSERRAKVLLIEEEPTLREISAFRLELLGYEVHSVDSAEKALEWLQRNQPTVMIVGQFLPGVSGVELVDRLSNDVRTSSIPVMYLSPNADLEHVQRAFTAGAKEYLVTPYDPLVLQQKVQQLVAVTTA
ncbi:MAG: response regulator [Planctomycetales bacterium]|nr:response regulator [Planctomycetales bacterium]